MNKNKKLVFMMALVMLISALSLFTVSFAAEDLGSWQTQASMSYTRFSLGVAEVNGKIYAIGGRSHAATRDKVEEYDPLTNNWVTKTSMPTARYALEAAGVNGKIYAIGGIATGNSASSIVEEYDPITDTWTTKSSMATARYDYALAEANGKIYVFGGNNGGRLNAVEEYDPLTDTWVTKTSMPTARYALEATEVNGKIYVVGGNAGSNHSDVVEEYDPIADTWTTKTSMPTAKYYFGLEECDGKIYAIGGNNAIGGNTSSIVEEYDPITDTWSTKTSMPTGRYDYGLAASNGKIYAIGGYGTTYLKTVEEFTPPAVTLPIPNTPSNLTATPGDSKITLNWNSVAEADSYNLKRSTTSGGPYTTVAQEVYGTIYTDNGVVNGTTYYYVVTAVNAGGESGNSNEASATPVAPSTGRALLKITMTNGSINEYDSSMNEVIDFIDWYDSRANGTGKAYYTIDKNYNIGPFVSRKDYIIFDKVLQFEIMEYTE